MLHRKSPAEAGLFTSSQLALAFALVTAMARGGREREPQDLNVDRSKARATNTVRGGLIEVICQGSETNSMKNALLNPCQILF